MKYSVAIIGSGPAGLTAGVYSSRAKLSTVIIEGNQPGGQLTTTTAVENWPGNVSIMGPDLMANMREHASSYGCAFVQENIIRVDFTKKPYTLFTESGKELQADAVIIATGASHKKLGCKGESEYFAKGVSTCSTCDAPFYQGKEVIVVGGGNSAVTEAEHLLHFAKKVTIVHILDQLTANDPIKDKVLGHPQASFIYSSTIKEICGDGQKVTEVILENQKDKSTQTIKADGVFIAIGFNPNTKLFEGQLEIDQFGYLVLQGHTQTSKEGIFAAGDVADFKYRQAITAAGMGCMAALDCQGYLALQDTK
jgi:thioredoxin reductase (NADPH)